MYYVTASNCIILYIQSPAWLKEQYVFLHDVVLESLLCGNTEMSCEMFSKEMNDLKHKDPKTGKSGLELQYEVLSNYYIHLFHMISFGQGLLKFRVKQYRRQAASYLSSFLNVCV